MAGEEQKIEPGRQLSPEILEIIVPALKVGGISGVSGLFVGSFAGVIRSNTPKLFALASGIQWATLGTTYWASRGLVLHAWGKDQVTPRERILASAVAGAASGIAGGALRGRKNVIPGAIMFTLFGATGQVLYNMADARNNEVTNVTTDGKQDSWLNSKWSPVKVLSSEEYEKILREKLLLVNAQISLVEESIEALRLEQEREAAVEKGAPKST